MTAAKTRSARSQIRLPVLLTALVFPGAGQFVQGRWGAGFFFTTVFGAALAVFLFTAGRIIVHYYRLAFSVELPHPPSSEDVRALVVSFAGSMLLYLAAVLDAYRAGVNASRRKERQP